MKTTFFATCALLIVFFGKPSLAEVSEGWNWKIGDNFEEVAALIPRYHEYGCLDERVTTEVHPLFMEIVGFQTAGRFHYINKNQGFVRIEAVDFNQKCEFEGLTDLYFCGSNGKLAAIRRIDVINTNNEFERHSPFNFEDPSFIGFSRTQHELLYSEFSGRRGIHFEVFHPESNTIRYSAFTPSWAGYGTHSKKSARAWHWVFKTKDGNPNKTSFEICPNGPMKIDPNFNPKFHSLQNVLVVNGLVSQRYNRTKSMVNKCIAWFPERKAAANQFWQRYESLNKEVFDIVSTKAEQMVTLLEMPSVSARYAQYKKWGTEDFWITKSDCDNLDDVESITKSKYIREIVDYISKVQITN